MIRGSSPHLDTPRGFILPAALFTMLIVALLAASLQAAVWQASRHARLGFAGERALHAADAAISQQLAHWDARAFASQNIGARESSTLELNAGLHAQLTVVRTAPDAAIIEASATSTQNGAPLNAQRRVTRALVVRAPPLPLTQPLTAFGPLTLATPGNISNTDEIPPDWTTECLGVTPIDAPIASIRNGADERALFDANWNKWIALASAQHDASGVTAVAPIVASGICVPGTGEPLRGSGSVAECANEWSARIITNAHPAHLTGSSRHQGVLLIDGDVELTGSLEVDGLLVVRGALDASLGTLTVHGAVLIRDESGHGSRLGIASRVRYSRCALRRALSAVGAPAAITTGGWLERF
jgi:hypothetical protein